MSICMRVVNRIECPTCGYPQSEAYYALDEAPYDPGCPYEQDTYEVQDLGTIETADLDSEDLVVPEHFWDEDFTDAFFARDGS